MPAEVRTGQVGEVLWLRMVRSSRCRGLGGGRWCWPAWRWRWLVNRALEALGWTENSEKRKTFWVGEML